MCLYRSGNNVDDIRKCDMTIQGESVVFFTSSIKFNTHFYTLTVMYEMYMQ